MTINSYHAHVYFSPGDEAQRARELLAYVKENVSTDVQIGRWHDEPIGPHPRGSYQLAFGVEHSSAMLQLLLENRNGLTIFMHGNSGDNYLDHTDYVVWLGESEDLRLDIFKST